MTMTNASRLQCYIWDSLALEHRVETFTGVYDLVTKLLDGDITTKEKIHVVLKWTDKRGHVRKVRTDTSAICDDWSDFCFIDRGSLRVYTR